MKVEPSIDKSALLERVRQEYGLEISQLTFLPKGEVSNNYIAEEVNGSRYLLKLLDASRLAQRATSRLEFILPLIWHLYSTGLFTRLPCPFQTRHGGFFADSGGSRLVLFRFIEGQILEGHWPYSEALRTAIATSVAIIHKSTSQLQLTFPYTEDFALPFEDALQKGLNTVKTICSHSRPGQQRLKDLLLPRTEEILDYLKRLHDLQRLARSKPRTLVLCHTDLTPANLLLNERDELFVLDWEGATLAPPEHDLFLFTGEHFPSFLRQYAQEYGPVRLDSDVFGFYLYRRNLEDLTDWVVRILYENTHEEQDENDLEGIREDCMSSWPMAIEEAIEKVRLQLNDYFS